MFTLYRLDLEHVVEKSKEEAIKTTEDFINILERRLKIVLLHYDEIIKYESF